MLADCLMDGYRVVHGSPKFDLVGFVMAAEQLFPDHVSLSVRALRKDEVDEMLLTSTTN